MPSLVHGLFTPLAEKLEMVSRWPDVDPAAVDAAYRRALEDGTLAGYEREVAAGNRFLDIVVTVYRGTPAETFLYAQQRMREAHGDSYNTLEEICVKGPDADRVVVISSDVRPFIPNHIAIEVIDLAANWDPNNGFGFFDIQEAQSSDLATFAVIFNAAESPEWVRKMDGVKVPYVIVGGLLLCNRRFSFADGYPPFVYRSIGRVHLEHAVNGRERKIVSAMPIVRKYER